MEFNDLVRLAQNYNVSDGGRGWYEGDFNYDGNVDFNDLVMLAQNYNTALPAGAVVGEVAADWALARASVPEPAAVLGAATGGLMLRRRRRSAGA